MRYILLVFAVLIFSCKEQPKTHDTSQVEMASTEKSQLEVYDYKGLKPLLHQQDDKVHVVNFWATWCAPCIKELPYFEDINTNYSKKNVEVLLVSLDFPRHYDSKLKPFLKEHQMHSKVVCLDDVDQNTWIPAIDSMWTGALPATIIYKGDKRKFYERSFTYDELENEVKQFLN